MKMADSQLPKSGFLPDDFSVSIVELFDESTERSFYGIKAETSERFLTSSVGHHLRKNWSHKWCKAARWATFEQAAKFAEQHFII